MLSNIQDMFNALASLDDSRAKSFFDSDSYYDAADNFRDGYVYSQEEARYEPHTYRIAEFLEIPFISDASIAVGYFVRQVLRVIAGSTSSAYLFPVVLAFQCFEIDDTDKRKQMFDLQFSDCKKCDNDRSLERAKKELERIEAEASLFKRFAHEKCAEKFFGLVDEAVKTAPKYEKALLEEILSAKPDCEKTFSIQLTVLEANLFGIKVLPVPRRNEWALDNMDGVVRDQLLDFLDFVDCLLKQPANEAAKFICMWSALLFRLIAKSPGSVEKAMKNFSDVFVWVTKTACTIKNYSLPLKSIETLKPNHIRFIRSAAAIALLKILSQPDNSRDMNLLKRSRKYCYGDALKYYGMKVVRLAFEAANVLKITVGDLLDLVLNIIPAESVKTMTRSIRHSCHLLKLFLRDFSNFDACDSWMYARVFDDNFFSRLKNKLHEDFVYFCCYVIDPQKRVGVGVWAMKHQPIPPYDEQILNFALEIRQKYNVD